MAEQLAAKLNNKLNYQPKEEDDILIPGNDNVFRKYEEELEINDFPQQARWKVTSKVGTETHLRTNFFFNISIVRRKHSLKSLNILKLVLRCVEPTFRLARRHLKENANCIWLLRVAVN